MKFTENLSILAYCTRQNWKKNVVEFYDARWQRKHMRRSAQISSARAIDWPHDEILSALKSYQAILVLHNIT